MNRGTVLESGRGRARSGRAHRGPPAEKLAVDSAFSGFQKPHVALFGIKDKYVVFALFPDANLHSLVTTGLYSHSGPNRGQKEC